MTRAGAVAWGLFLAGLVLPLAVFGVCYWVLRMPWVPALIVGAMASGLGVTSAWSKLT